MKKLTGILMAIALLLSGFASPYEAMAACNHERMCYDSECVNCGKPYTGNNIIHSTMSSHWESSSTWHWQYCLDCGKLISEGEHWNYCCQIGFTSCSSCYAEYSPPNIIHHMWETDEGVPFCCCGEKGSYDDAQKAPANNYKTDYLYKNSAPLFETVLFGAFEQDNNINNGKEPIEWYILYSDHEKALLLSRFALTNMNFNKTFADVTWETSTIREWLNTNFYRTAFLYDEQVCILTNQKGYTNSYCEYGEIATADEVFLLSLDELNFYIDTVLRRQLIATPYAKANGIQVKDNYSWWWLRTNGNSNKTAQIVFETGYISTIGRDVSSYVGGVRPAIWVDISVIR